MLFYSLWEDVVEWEILSLLNHYHWGNRCSLVRMVHFFLCAPALYSLWDSSFKLVWNFEMLAHQLRLSSELERIQHLHPFRNHSSNSDQLLESVVQTQQACKDWRVIGSPSGLHQDLGKQSQIIHEAVEPDFCSFPPSQDCSTALRYKMTCMSLIQMNVNLFSTDVCRDSQLYDN